MTLAEIGKTVADFGYFGGFLLAAWLARPVLAALRDLARVNGALLAEMVERGAAVKASEERAEMRHREAMCAIDDVKATVVARL